MLYQVILTSRELELIKISLETAADHYDEYCQDDNAEQVRQLLKAVKLETMEF